MIGTIVVVAGLAPVLWLANGVRRIGAVSRGAPIGPRRGTALLLIDLQTVFWESDLYEDRARSQAGSAILDEIAAARAEGLPVVAVRQEWSIPSTKLLARLTMRGRAVAGTSGTGLAAPFDGMADHVLVKRVQDAFETGALDRLLAQLDVGRLRIVGLDTNYCVARTASAARQRGYAVELVTRASLAADPQGAARTVDRLAAIGVDVR